MNYLNVALTRHRLYSIPPLGITRFLPPPSLNFHPNENMKDPSSLARQPISV